jgi:hypothetical protein
MKTLRQAALYAVIVLVCVSSAAWQPEPAADLIDSAVLIARGAPLLAIDAPPSLP